jgi:hypothetical protein
LNDKFGRAIASALLGKNSLAAAKIAQSQGEQNIFGEIVIIYTILILFSRYTHPIGSTWELMKWRVHFIFINH